MTRGGFDGELYLDLSLRPSLLLAPCGGIEGVSGASGIASLGARGLTSCSSGEPTGEKHWDFLKTARPLSITRCLSSTSRENFSKPCHGEISHALRRYDSAPDPDGPASGGIWMELMFSTLTQLPSVVTWSPVGVPFLRFFPLPVKLDRCLFRFPGVQLSGENRSASKL